MTSVDAEERETPKSIWEELDEWAQAFMPWQRFVLWRAIQSGSLGHTDVDTAYQLFLHDNGLGEPPNPAVEIPESLSGRPTKAETTKLILEEIRDLVGVNALPSTAKLNFSSGLTIIYGRNGAGKSGFSRILSNIVFSRARHAILPNIYESNQPVPQATIVISDGDGSKKPLTLPEAKAEPDLKRITLFDSSVARTHLVEQTALGFKPTGFDVFPEMARVYRMLEERLEGDIRARRRENPCASMFAGKISAVADLVTGLNGKSDVAQMRKLADFGEAEEARLQEVDRQIQELQSSSPAATIRTLSEAKREISGLVERFETAKKEFSAEKLNTYQGQLDEWVKRANAVTQTGVESFRCDPFQHVGSVEWERFIGAAKDLAAKESPDYPAHGDHCLLCRQPLDDAAIALMQRLWAFLSSDVRQRLEEVSAIIDRSAARLSALPLETISEGTTLQSSLQNLNAALAERARHIEVGLREYADRLIAGLTGGTAVRLPALSLGDDTIDELRALAEQTQTDIDRLGEQNVTEALADVGKEKLLLEHRKLLNGALDRLLQLIEDYAWADKAALVQRLLNTRPLTDRETELFTRIIAEGYRGQLQVECEHLDCGLPIELKAMGRRGETLRSLSVRGGHRPDTIFSEGEQRAVSLADFLTEVSLNPASAGIVLDDPVTSQDHQRKERFASRLVDESKRRQVIIFTHDLVFLTMLLTAADEAGINALTHWVERNSEGQPGHVSLDDCPATTPQYRSTNKAKETLAEAKKTIGSERLRLIQRGMAELRRTVEEIVPHFLFKNVVNRWTDRIIVTALKRVNWDQAAVAEIERLYEELSAIIEGHTHTEERAGAPAEPSDLEGYITRVDDLIKSIRKDRQ